MISCNNPLLGYNHKLTPKQRQGEDVFLEWCSACHVNMESNTEFLSQINKYSCKKRKLEVMQNIVQNADHPSNMPKLSDEELHDIIAYVREIQRFHRKRYK